MARKVKLKICLFTSSFLPEIGGLEVAVDNLAQQLSMLGHQPVLFTQRPRNIQGTVERSYPIIHYERPLSTTWFPYSVQIALQRLHVKHRFDVIHAHQAYMPGYIAARVGRKYRIPTVITCHGGDVAPRGRYRKRWISRRRIVWALKYSDAVTSVGNWLANEVKVLTDNSIRAMVINNGIILPEDKVDYKSVPESLKMLKDKQFIMTLGRLRKHKGLDLLLKAIKQLLAEGKDVPYLVITGDGRERETLEQFVTDNNLTEHVGFVGNMLGKEKNWLLARCKFLIQPSRSEALGITVLEAMSYGKAVLATAVGGLPELVFSNQNGLLVETENVAALAKGLDKMLSVDLSKYSANARKTAEKYSWHSIIQCYLDLYYSLAKH